MAAQQLDCSEDQLELQFAELSALLPGIKQRMHTIKADHLARLVADPAKVAERLIELKAIFPQANVEQMVLKDFNLLLSVSTDQVSQAADELRAFLPGQVNIDRCRILTPHRSE